MSSPPPNAIANAFCVVRNRVVVAPGSTVTPPGVEKPGGSRVFAIAKLRELCTPPIKYSAKGENRPALLTNTRGPNRYVNCVCPTERSGPEMLTPPCVVPPSSPTTPKLLLKLYCTAPNPPTAVKAFTWLLGFTRTQVKPA